MQLKQDTVPEVHLSIVKNVQVDTSFSLLKWKKYRYYGYLWGTLALERQFNGLKTS